jgi:hypothetical protein
MSGALRSLTPPPIPNPQGISLGVQRKPGNAPAIAPTPAPTHKQTVAGLRHLDAIVQKLQAAMRDPDLGRANMKNKLIDGMTSLVAEQLNSPGEAVQTLSTFPERPFEQKQWVMNHLVTALQSRDNLLDHHRAAFPEPVAEPTPSADSHMDDIAGMIQAHYSSGGRNA